MKKNLSIKNFILLLSVMCSVNIISDAKENINHHSIDDIKSINIDLSDTQQQQIKYIIEGKHVLSPYNNSGAITENSTNRKANIPQYIEVESISVSINAKKIRVGDTYQLKAIIEPSDATNKTVKWRSYDPEIASIDNNGLITANGIGSTTITATSVNDLKAFCEITVVDQDVETQMKWEGHYNVSSTTKLVNATKEYPNNFEMDIEKVGNELYLTSFLGENLKEYYEQGFHLQDNGDGTANINLQNYSILKYTNKNNPFYLINVWDNEKKEWSDYWEFRMNDDGTISIGDFYVVSYTWSENDGKWTEGKIESKYTDITAQKDENYIPKEFTYQGVNYVVLDEVETYTHIMAPQIVGGIEYVMVAEGNAGISVEENREYGYLNKISVEEDCIGINLTDKTSLCNFNIETAPGGNYYIKDSYGRYLYQKGTYDSFNVSYDLPEDGAIWSIEISSDDGTAKIFNLYAEKFIQFNPDYMTYGSYSDERGILPKLYVKIPEDYVKTYNRKCMTKPGELGTPGTIYNGNLIIPEYVYYGQEKFLVVAIGNLSFNDNEDLTSVDLTHSILSIGELAFSNCDNLNKVNIPNGVLTIGGGAFMYSNISSIELPSSLSLIAEMAFAGNNYNYIFIPQNVSCIGKRAFNCETLQNIQVDTKNKFCSSLNGVLFDKSQQNLVLFPAGKTGKYSVPNCVNTIKKGAFYNSQLSYLNISNLVNTIETDAIHECDSLTTVALPSSLKEIYAKAFGACRNLKNIYYNTTNPIVTEESICSESIYTQATLNVPEEAIAVFKSVNPWKKFRKIEGFKTIHSIDEAIDKASLLKNGEYSDPYFVDFGPIVTFVGAGVTYISSEGRYFAIYGGNLGVVPGQILNKGWAAKLHNYYGLLEFIPLEDTTIIGGDIMTVPDPVRISNSTQINRDLLSAVVYIPDVEFNEATPENRVSFTGKLRNQYLIFYNNYAVPSQPAGTYDVIGTVGSYYDQLQIQPIEFIKANSVDEINIDEHIEYYNLQGLRITTPEKGGIYIRKKGQKVDKIIFPK